MHAAVCPPRDRDTKALGQLFQVPVVLSLDRIIGCRARADVQTRCRPAAIHNSGRAHETGASEWLSAKLHAERATCLARFIDRCTGGRVSFALARLDMCSFRVEAFLPPVAGGPAPVDIRTVQEILTYRSLCASPFSPARLAHDSVFLVIPASSFSRGGVPMNVPKCFCRQVRYDGREYVHRPHIYSSVVRRV